MVKYIFLSFKEFNKNFQRLGKKIKQNRQIPNWTRFKTGNTIRYEIFE